MCLHGLSRIHVDRLHEPPRLVGADRQEREINRPEPLPDVVEQARVCRVASEEIRTSLGANMKPPHKARFRSSSPRAEKCCAGVTMMGMAEDVASCHQSSSSTRRIPAGLTAPPFPEGLATSR